MNAPVRAPRVHVTYFVATMDVGGSELNALRTAELIDKTRFDVTVASLAGEGPLLDRFRDAGLRVVHFSITSLYNHTTVREGLRLLRFLRRERVDVLHCHDAYSNVFAMPWGRLARTPVLIASRRWIHAIDDRRFELANRLSYKLAHRVLGNSGAVARLLKSGDRVPESRILQVPNFVDERTFRPLSSAALASLRAELEIPEQAEVVGCVARLAAIKDHATLIRAVALVAGRRPNIHLVLVGDGECRPELERLAAELGIARRVHFAGFRPNTPNLNHLFDVAALASLSEGFSNSIVEAMAAGRPIVATDVGGNADAVLPSTGILVPVRDPERFAAALERLLEDGALRHRMGQSSLRTAREQYDASTVIAGLESIYFRLLGRSDA